MREMESGFEYVGINLVESEERSFNEAGLVKSFWGGDVLMSRAGQCYSVGLWTHGQAGFQVIGWISDIGSLREVFA